MTSRCSAPYLVLAAITASLLSAPRTAPAQDCLARDGLYLFAGGDEQRAQFSKMLDHSSRGINPLLRPLGERILRRWITIPRHINLNRRGDQVWIEIAPFPARASRLDGTPSSFTDVRGNACTIRRRLLGTSLIEQSEQRHITRHITYRFDSSCRTLETSWRMISTRDLFGELLFDLSFRQREPEGAPQSSSISASAR